MTQALSKDWLIARIATMIEDDEPVDTAENLTLYGLDSIAVMGLIAELERQGIRLGFEEMAKDPTIDGWWDLISTRKAA